MRSGVSWRIEKRSPFFREGRAISPCVLGTVVRLCPSERATSDAKNSGAPSASPPAVWSTQPKKLEALQNEIHIWRASLKCAPEFLRRMNAILSSDERQRSAQFHFAPDREAFVAARGILRELLGAYLNRPCSELRFQYGPQGKPSLAPIDPDWPIRFNLAHTRHRVLYAFATSHEVGIDLEYIRPQIAEQRIAEMCFSAAEITELRTLPIDLQPQGFFNGWTRKEAYLKAQGCGLQQPLDSFDVTLTPGRPAQFLRGVESRWNIAAFAPEPQHVAALVFDGHGCKLRFFQFDHAAFFNRP